MCALARSYFRSISYPLFCLFLLIWISNEFFHHYVFILCGTVFVPQYLKTAQAVLVIPWFRAASGFRETLLSSAKYLKSFPFQNNTYFYQLFTILRNANSLNYHFSLKLNKQSDAKLSKMLLYYYFEKVGVPPIFFVGILGSANFFEGM